MLSTLTIKKNTCKIFLSASLVLSSNCGCADEHNDWDLVDDTEKNITYYELRSDESVRYIVDTKDFRLKRLDNEFRAVMPVELGPVLKIEDLGLYGKVQKRMAADGTIGICFSRQASMPSGSISVYNNYIYLVRKKDIDSGITYVFLSNTPCVQSFYLKGGYFVSSRLEITNASNRFGNIYEVKVNLKQLVQVSKGGIRLSFDSRHLVWESR